MRHVVLGVCVLLLLSGSALAAPQVTLTWQNNLPAGTQIDVWRGAGSCPMAAGAKIAMLPGQPAAYTDTAVVNGQSYCYGVISTNSSGSSAMSNQVTATVPLAVPASPSNLTGTVTP